MFLAPKPGYAAEVFCFIPRHHFTTFRRPFCRSSNDFLPEIINQLRKCVFVSRLSSQTGRFFETGSVAYPFPAGHDRCQDLQACYIDRCRINIKYAVLCRLETRDRKASRFNTGYCRTTVGIRTLPYISTTLSSKRWDLSSDLTLTLRLDMPTGYQTFGYVFWASGGENGLLYCIVQYVHYVHYVHCGLHQSPHLRPDEVSWMTYYDPILFPDVLEARPLTGSAPLDGGLLSATEADHWLETNGNH